MAAEVFDFPQGSPEWHEIRLGLPTASRFADILAKGEGRMRRSLLLQLAGEIVTGEPSDNYTNRHMDRGTEQEPEARELYALITGKTPVQVGFIRDLDLGAGASPDALIDDDGGLEIKAGLPSVVIDQMMKGGFPASHRAQCQGNLWLSGRKWWDLALYHPRLPLFISRIERDEEYIRTLAAAVAEFNAELAAMVDRVRRYGEAPAETVRRDIRASLEVVS